jgi:hypothetical protein
VQRQERHLNAVREHEAQHDQRGTERGPAERVGQPERDVADGLPDLVDGEDQQQGQQPGGRRGDEQAGEARARHEGDAGDRPERHRHATGRAEEAEKLAAAGRRRQVGDQRTGRRRVQRHAGAVAPAIMKGRRPQRSAPEPIHGRSSIDVMAKQPMTRPMAPSEVPRRLRNSGSVDSRRKKEK